MDKNAKMQLASIREKRIDDSEKEMIEWVNLPEFGAKRRQAILPLIQQIGYPAFWVDTHTLMARIYFLDPHPDRIHPFTIRNCRATTKGFVAVFKSKRHVLEIRDRKLYFPEGV